jgi:hypothetical protein
MNTRKALKRIRSTTAPETSATVMMQNVASKAMIALPARGSNLTPRSATSPSPPMNPLPLSKASE